MNHVKKQLIWFWSLFSRKSKIASWKKKELLIFSVIFIGLQRFFNFCISCVFMQRNGPIPNSNFPPVFKAIHGLSTALYFLALLFPLSFCGQQPKAWLRDPTKWAKLHLFQPHHHRVNCHKEKLTKIKKFSTHILNISNWWSQIFHLQQAALSDDFLIWNLLYNNYLLSWNTKYNNHNYFYCYHYHQRTDHHHHYYYHQPSSKTQFFQRGQEPVSENK